MFADTMYETEEDYNNANVEAKNNGFQNLAKDLEMEYYTTIPFLEHIL
ncbi:hypothetical protein PH210_20785 [Paenibacillus sp. BSR1-1]|nr:hypothetical protein [Paenibacillus sp. BSR1-1]MDN3018626.1 hypothetical protein [Paenibacillus sp. BSR1-1]